MEQKTGMLMQRYEVGRMLGQGSFARVYYARSLKTGEAVAIKMIDKEKVMSRVGMMEQIKREISVMGMVRHPNIIHLYEVMATKTKIYFVIEYAKGGELFDKVAKGKLQEDVARMYFHQLISAVDFCHSRGVYHRDLKPENLLLDENENLKVSDFGLSALAETRHQDGLLHTMCGTPDYVAPEVIGRKGYDGAKADIWSCGVILFVLLAGYLPFHDNNLMHMYQKIGKAEYKCPSWFPRDARRLLAKILDPNPDTRISMAKIKDSSWLKKASGLKSRSESTRSDSQDTDASVNRDGNPGPSGNISADIDGKQEEVIRPKELNAFDIISLSCGFDLSGLFEECGTKKGIVLLTSGHPAPVIISRLIEMAKALRLKVKRMDKGLLNFEATKAGRKGSLSIDTEIFELTPTVYMVEMRKRNGDTLEYQKVLKEDIRPALRDIAWAWQGDRQQQQQQQPPPLQATSTSQHHEDMSQSSQ